MITHSKNETKYKQFVDLCRGILAQLKENLDEKSRNESFRILTEAYLHLNCTEKENHEASIRYLLVAQKVAELENSEN